MLYIFTKFGTGILNLDWQCKIKRELLITESMSPSPLVVWLSLIWLKFKLCLTKIIFRLLCPNNKSNICFLRSLHCNFLKIGKIRCLQCCQEKKKNYRALSTLVKYLKNPNINSRTQQRLGAMQWVQFLLPLLSSITKYQVSKTSLLYSQLFWWVIGLSDE